MELSLFGRALGACLAKADNLRAVYLPEGVPVAIAEAIVREANRIRIAEPPFAVLVSETGESNPDDYTRVWPVEDVIKYRQGDRLIVGLGRHADFHSISTSFAEVFGLSYPEAATGPVSLRNVASAVVEVVLNASGISRTDFFDQDAATERLERCLTQLRDIHVEMRRGDLVWNAQWFTHVGRGVDRLAQLISHKMGGDEVAYLDDVFAAYAFAAFSLPNPGPSMQIRKSGVGKAVVAAMDDWWSDETAIKATVQHLKHHPDTEADDHPLAGLVWDNFDADVVDDGNPLLAMLRRRHEVIQVVEAFAALTASQFLDPTNNLADEGLFVFCNLEGGDLAVSTTSGTGPALLTSEFDDDDQVLSQMVRVRIPSLATPSDEETADSSLTFSVSPAAFTWEGELEVGPEGALWAVGSFRRALKGDNARPLVPATVSLRVDADDSLAHLVPSTVTGTILIAPPIGAGVVLFRIGAKGMLGRPVVLGPESIAEARESQSGLGATYSTVLDAASSSFRVVVWTNVPHDSVLHEGKPVAALDGRPTIFGLTLTPHGLDVIEAAGQRFELVAAEQKTSVQSPIVAAIDRLQVSGDSPSSETLESVRGRLESEYSANITSESWLLTHGHIVVSGDNDKVPFGDFEAASKAPAFLMHPEVSAVWDALTDESVPAELLNSKEAEDFRKAFSALGIADSMEREGDESTDVLDWAARTSWKHLWLEERGKLEAYLQAFSVLIAKAKEVGSPWGIFWASYPFSASIWNTTNVLECSAVLLSPLHPIRLAWLASVEGTLWEAEDAKSLAGSVEGWNFPFFGPRQTKNGRMIAIPMDAGEGQLFLGWSMLVGASIDGEKPLIAPHRVGRLVAPGTAASGLNATAATSALRSYRRMHPHVSTLTVDLAATTRSSRLEEVDNAVLAQLEEWAKEKSGTFRGGARVLDSLCRDGNVPSAAVSQLARKNLGMPLLWSRYQPDIQTSQACNIRLLQDSGVHVEVGSSSSLNLGVVSEVPLRRFEAAASPSVNAKVAHSRPAMHEGRGGWGAFVEALNAVEDAAGRPQVVSKLHKAALVDGRADWTVTGESLLSPAAMAALVQNGGAGSQMLWEWRPPFLEATKDVPVLERRPYVSVARVPFGFKSRLKSLIQRVTGEPADDSAVQGLLGKLGSRGVGLSSLLAMGGTQATGALGFYLAFALAEFVDGRDGSEHLALPIDACDTFLKALAGTTEHGAKTKRADMLILSIAGDALTLVPVEIKFYGLDAAGQSGHLPGPHDSDLNEALGQLDSTMALLKRVEERGATLRGTEQIHEYALWKNALTTLVEAGIRLKPAGATSSPSLPERLQGIADGTIPLRIGKPVVTYFKHDALTLDGSSFSTHIAVPRGSVAGDDFGALVANSRSAFESIDDRAGRLAEEWRDVVSWAVNSRGPQETSDAGETLYSSADSDSDDDHQRSDDYRWPAEHEGQSSQSTLPDLGSAQSSESSDPALVEFGEGIRFPVGQLLGTIGGGAADFWPSNTALNQMNVGVVGDLGTGKTELLKSLMSHLRAEARMKQENPLSILVFDYKGDFQGESFLSAVGGRVLPPVNIPLNIFAIPGPYSPYAAFKKASGFCDILSKIYSGIGVVQRSRLVTVITDLFKERDGDAPILSEVRERYAEVGKPDAVSSLLDAFVLGEVFSADRAALKPFDELIDGTILVLALDHLGADLQSKNSLVALFLNFYYEFMLNSQKWPFVGDAPQLRRLNSFLLVDEAVNIMRYSFPVLMDLMLQGRQFGVGTILASQYLSHFKDGSGPNYGDPLLTWFIHKVPNVTAKQLSQLGIPGATEVAAKKISELKVHEAYYSSLGFPGRFIRGTPFYEL